MRQQEKLLQPSWIWGPSAHITTGQVPDSVDDAHTNSDSFLGFMSTGLMPSDLCWDSQPCFDTGCHRSNGTGVPWESLSLKPPWSLTFHMAYYPFHSWLTLAKSAALPHCSQGRRYVLAVLLQITLDQRVRYISTFWKAGPMWSQAHPKEGAPCVCALSHTKALQSLYRVKKYKLTEVCPFSCPPELGKNSVFKGLHPGLNALVIHAVTQKEWYGSHGILTHRKPPLPSLQTSDTASHLHCIHWSSFSLPMCLFVRKSRKGMLQMAWWILLTVISLGTLVQKTQKYN